MVERQPLEGQRRGRVAPGEGIERDGARHRARNRLGLAEIGHDHDLPRRGKLRGDGLELVGERDALAVVPIAVDREEDFRLDLAETVEHAALAEIGRAGRPDRPERGHRQHERDAFRQVRQHGGDAVAPADAGRAQGLLQAGDCGLQLIPGQAAGRLVLAAEHDGVAAAAPGEQILGKVDARVGKEGRPRHGLARGQARALFAHDAAEIPQQIPEGARLRNRPEVEVRIALQGELMPEVRLLHEGHELGGGHAFRPRHP